MKLRSGSRSGSEVEVYTESRWGRVLEVAEVGSDSVERGPFRGWRTRQRKDSEWRDFG